MAIHSFIHSFPSKPIKNCGRANAKSAEEGGHQKLAKRWRHEAEVKREGGGGNGKVGQRKKAGKWPAFISLNIHWSAEGGKGGGG
jgi:hypothetical protein